MNFIEDNSEECSRNDKKAQYSTTTGRIIIALTGGIAVGITLISASFVSPALRKYCLPYIPATDKQIKNVLIALRGRTGSLLDLGSGDGRIVIETAKLNFFSHGVELNPWLVLYSRFDALRKGVKDKSSFFRKDLWTYNVSRYDNIVIFGVEQMMRSLEEKLQAECKHGCRIIACRFPLPSEKPLATIGSGIDAVWLYKVDRKKRQ